VLGLERAVVESVEVDGNEQVVVAVRPHHRERDRCGVCGRLAPGFDLGEGRRRWRALDLGTTIAHLEADAPRAPGRDKATVEAFFDALGSKRAKRLKLVSCDMAGWIEAVLGKRCPKAKRCVDPFRVVQLATEALDEIRREVWNEARRQGQGAVAAELKGARYALWKNPENLTERQQSKLADIERLNRPLYRAYLLKEQLRQIYRLGPMAAVRLLDEWLSWARRCRLRPFVKLARTIAAQREGIVAAIRHGLSNARVEAINTQIRLIARRAFGFHSPEALISLAMLKLGGLCTPLRGRVAVR
jgi:transposase